MPETAEEVFYPLDKVGEMCRAARQEIGMSLLDCALFCGTHTEILSRFERDQQTLSLSASIKLAKLLGMEEKKLLISTHLNRLCPGIRNIMLEAIKTGNATAAKLQPQLRQAAVRLPGQKRRWDYHTVANILFLLGA